MLLISATALGIAVWSMSRGNIVCAAGIATATNTPLAALQTMAIHSSTTPVRLRSTSTPWPTSIRSRLPTTSRYGSSRSASKPPGIDSTITGIALANPTQASPSRERVEFAHGQGRTDAQGLEVERRR